ncbi:MAG: omp31-2, partial [Devosia sp.]|nr:omp31-2 [Devosia sp.]
MRILIIATMAATLMAGTAGAADLVLDEGVAPVYSSPTYDWNGFYVGINGGYGGGVFKHPLQLIGPESQGEVAPALVPPGPGEIILATGSADVTAGGFVGGVQVGYNW